ncbi:3-oxoacyl-[acyl-carrier-protein] reductase [Methanococcoides vulcani]|uniref:3-oxoacyl-[acyl-carrier-protein] reductase n=1 Tax=Methanococcoides vulcani TaxID=1353158 RepID=A0A1I0B0S4_9EURY|nr:3-oxoacyl-ACP reductase family protein [Methanococcoides vulcani]SET00308.1 3-oxoacyl-[acyl-carrier-protein] reductase [Methanococcoides vulcani]
MLKDKVVLITGASRGIGRATALLAAENHAHVIINYKESEEKAAELVENITEKGLQATMIKADVSVENEVKDMFDFIKKHYSKLDILVNNAGILKSNLLAMTSTELFDHTIDVNLKGTFLCSRYASNMMRKQGSGKIINLSSVIGLNGNAGQTVYSASKAGVIGFTKSAAKELGRYGITVNAIAPGFIETDLTRDIKEEVREKIISNIALGRSGNPEDVAKVVLFLSSELGNYVSGQVISVDGCQII